MKVKEESEKVGLKLNIQKMKIMVSGSITSWHGETMETVRDFYYLGPQSCLTVCDPMDCSTPGFLVLHYLPEFVQTHVH